jgi:hypothetical protein
MLSFKRHVEYISEQVLKLFYSLTHRLHTTVIEATASKDFLDIVTILDLNDVFYVHCWHEVCFLTYNMITGKFENMARNHLLLIKDVTDAIFCVNIEVKQHALEKNKSFYRGYFQK